MEWPTSTNTKGIASPNPLNLYYQHQFHQVFYFIVVSKTRISNWKKVHQPTSKEGGVAWSPYFTQFTRTAFFLLWKQLQWWMLPVCQWGERAKVTFMPGKKNCGSHTSVFKLWGVKVCLIWYTCQPKCFSRSALKCPPTHKITISGFSQRPIIPQDPNSKKGLLLTYTEVRAYTYRLDQGPINS